jgi:hypothetical protein
MFLIATATFRILYALIVLGHDRAEKSSTSTSGKIRNKVWLSRQMTEAFPCDTAPLAAGPAFRDRVRVMDMKEVV